MRQRVSEALLKATVQTWAFEASGKSSVGTMCTGTQFGASVCRT